MMSFLISIFGFLISKLVLSRFENVQLVHAQKSKIFFIILSFPFYLTLFFKDQLIFFMVYIGIFVSTLILFFLFFEKYAFYIFSSRKNSLLSALIFLIQSGNSPQKAIHECYFQLTEFEKYIFQPILYVFDENFQNLNPRLSFSADFAKEIRSILLTKTKITDQLRRFQSSIQLENEFRQKSEAIYQQIGVQMMMSVVIYVLLFAISWLSLGLKQHPDLILVSFLLLLAGIYGIFNIGKKIKWNI